MESLEQIVPWRFVYCNISGSGEPERVQGFRVSSNIFPLLGAKPARGRTFLPQEEQAGRDRVAILSYAYWQRRFGSGNDIVGRTIHIDGEAVTVIGGSGRRAGAGT